MTDTREKSSSISRYNNNYSQNSGNNRFRNNNNNNNNNYRNYQNNRNNNNRNNNRNNTTNSKQRHQNRARATLLNELVVCDKERIPLSADNKVFKQIISEGNGSRPLSTSVLAVNYVGRLSDGTVFDSFVDPQLPYFLNMNRASLVPALEMCILGMNIGEKCLLTSTFEYGYGQLGCPPRIPVEAKLQYEIELFYSNIDLADLDDGTVQGKLAAAMEAKKAGNHFFYSKMFRAAVHYYKMGESRVKDLISESSGEDLQQLEGMVITLNLNLAACAIQSRLYDIALMNCDRALTLDPNNIKGLFRLSQAHAGNLDFLSAKRTLVKAITLKPNDLSLRHEYAQLLNKELKNKQNEEGNLRGNPTVFILLPYLSSLTFEDTSTKRMQNLCSRSKKRMS